MTIKVTKTKPTLPAEQALKKTWEKMTFGSLIRSLRLSDELSQVALAEELGVSRQFLNSVELGRRRVGIAFAKKVAKVMAYSVEPMIELLLREQLKREGFDFQVEIKSKKAS